MFRNALFKTFALIILMAVPAAGASAYNVLAVKSADIAPYNEAVEGFRKTCGCRVTEVSLSDLDQTELRREAFDSRADMLFAAGADALSQALALKNLPVVYSMVISPRIPAEISSPVAGVSMYVSPEKYIGSMLELFPSVKRIGIVYNRAASEAFVHEAEHAVQRRGLELVKGQVERPSEVYAVVDSLRNIDLLWMIPDATVVNPDTFKHMLNYSYKTSVPIFTFSRKYVELGAAAGLHSVPSLMGGQAGEIALRLFRGKEAHTLLRVDVRSPQLVVNERVLNKLGRPLNSDAMRRAVHVR